MRQKMICCLLLAMALLAGSAWADTVYELNKSYPATVTENGGKLQCSVLRAVLDDIEAKTTATLGNTTIQFSDTGSAEVVYSIDLNNNYDYATGQPTTTDAYKAYIIKTPYLQNGGNVWGWKVTWEKTGTAPIVLERASNLRWMNFGHSGINVTIKGLNFRAQDAAAGGYMLETTGFYNVTDCTFEHVGLAAGGWPLVWGPEGVPLFTNCTFKNMGIGALGAELRNGRGRFFNCIFENCTTAVSVGSAWDSDAGGVGPCDWTLDNCIIRDANQVAQPYGVLHYGGWITLNNCTLKDVNRPIIHNFTPRSTYRNGTVRLNGCTVIENERTPFHSGTPLIYLNANKDANTGQPISFTTITLSRCNIFTNIVQHAVQFNGNTTDAPASSIVLDRCLIKNTYSGTVSFNKDGLYVYRGGKIKATNCVIKGFYRNAVLDVTNAVSAGREFDLSLINCVLAGSKHASDGAVTIACDVAPSSAKFTMLNSIIDSDNTQALIVRGSAPANVTRDIRNNMFRKSGSTEVGTNALDSSVSYGPLSRETDDYHIAISSGVCGKGLPVSETGVAEDFDGDPRPNPASGTATDLGIDEVDESLLGVNAAKHWSLY